MCTRPSVNASKKVLMKTSHDVIRERLHKQAGLVEPKPPITLEELEKQWSPEFEKLMRNRLMMGALRYGMLGDPTKPQYDRVGSICKRLKKYEETGNLEHLVDAANECLCEFVESRHPKKHFLAADNTTLHTSTK